MSDSQSNEAPHPQGPSAQFDAQTGKPLPYDGMLGTLRPSTDAETVPSMPAVGRDVADQPTQILPAVGNAQTAAELAKALSDPGATQPVEAVKPLKRDKGIVGVPVGDSGKGLLSRGKSSDSNPSSGK